jgi:hypothetical protein
MESVYYYQSGYMRETVKVIKMKIKKFLSYNPILDLRRQEVKVPFLLALISTISFYFFLVTNEISYITTIIQNVSLAIAIGLVGILGFLISALAIITSTIKNEVILEMEKQNVYDSLQAILSNFTYLGKIIGYTSILYFIIYFVVSINVKAPDNCLICLAFILSYLLFYIICAAIDLLETSKEIFEINYTYFKATIKKEELQKLFDDLRINYLSKVVYENQVISKERFINDLLELVDLLYGDLGIDRSDLKNYIKSYYGS